MNLKKLLSKLSLIIVLLTVFAANASAQTYVSNTNGNDITGNGKDVGIGLPYKTIAVGISNTADGGTIVIDADVYGEAGPIDLTGGGTGKNLTFIARAFNGLQVATITNGIAVGTAKTVNLGLTGVQFQTGTVNLTAGTLNIASGNLIISTSTGFAPFLGIVRTAGTINATPTTVNVNVTYNGAANITAGNELPASLGTGTLSASLSVAKTVTINSALTVNNIIVNATSTLSFTQNATLTNDIDNSGTIQLNSTTLTWAPAASVGVTKLGTIVSATAGTIGSGTILLSGKFSITLDGAAGTVPNLTVPAGYTGGLTLGNALTVDGTFTLSSATLAVVALANQTMNVRGDFLRTDNTVGNFTTGLGVLNFVGGSAQTFNPGASLTLYDLTVNKTAGTIVHLAASVSVSDNLTVTTGSLDVGNFNLNMVGTGVNVVTNNGLAYSSTLLGYIVFQGTGGLAGGTVTGTGTFGNILVNLPAGNNVNTSGAVNFSGILYINQGNFRVNAAVMTFNNTLVPNPTIKINTGNASNFQLVFAGTTTYSAFVNLDYFGTGSYVAGSEWTAASALANINNLTIEVASAQTVTGAAAASTINGTLKVTSGATLLGNAYTLAGTSQAHTVLGTISAGTLIETGNGSSITGSTVSTDAATITNLTINVGAAGTFTSTNLKSIASLTNTSGTSTVTMNTTTAAITGNLTLTAGALTLAMGSTAAQQTVAGTSTLTAGTLTLGSNIIVAGQTSQVAGNLALGSFNYTQLGSIATPDYNRTAAGTVTASTGNLVFDATAAAIDFQPGATFTVPNLTMIAAANGITMDAAFTVSNSLTHTSGTVNYSNITLSGPTYAYNAGTSAATITGTFTVTNAASTLTFNGNTTIPTFVVNAPSGTVTIASSSSTARTITASTAFTLTAGTLALGSNALAITGTFSRAAAGAITEAAAGNLIFNNGTLDFVTGAGFSIDNLEIQANATNLTDNNVYTVNKNLVLTAGTLTNDEKLTIGNGALVTVNAGFLTSTVAANYPLNAGSYDVIYLTTGAYAAGDEIPATATVLRNLTVNNGAAVITLTNGGQVNGTFYEKAGNFTIPTAKTVTLVAGGTWDIGLGSLTLLGTGKFAKTTYNLIYSDGFTGVTNASTEFPVSTTNILSLQVLGNNTSISLDAAKTVSGPITINGNGSTAINFAGYQLSVLGNVTVTTGGFINSPATTGTLTFAGTTAQTLTVPAAGLTFPLVGSNSAVLEINNMAGVQLAGGNLTMLDPTNKYVAPVIAPLLGTPITANVLKLTAGVFSTGLNSVTLWQYFSTGTPLQGYTRTAGYINGNVTKLLDATGQYYTSSLANVSTALTRVEFPVGSATNYRPMAYQFNSLPTANFNLTVTEVDNNPGGTNGFSNPPLMSGNLQLANYPPFYWLVTSDLTLQPQVTYDIEAEANGYDPSNYPEGIQNVRFLRRFAPVATTSNPWVLQGSSTGTAIYDNSTVSSGLTAHAKVIVRSAIGAISTQGALFTFSQVAKAPTVATTATPAIIANAVTIATGTALTVTYTATSLNLGGTATFNAAPVWTATAPAVVPTNATFAAGTLTWTPSSSQTGVYTVAVTAVDGTLSTTNILTITVTPGAPSFTATGALTNATATASVLKALSLTYKAITSTGDVLAYTVTANKAVSAAATITAAGVLAWTPAVSDIALSPVTFTVTATSSVTSLTAATTTVVTVGYGVAVGDVNADGSITAADASLILQEVVGLVTFTPVQMYAADVNADSKVGALDAAWILYYSINGKFPGASKTAALAASASFGKLAANNELMELPISIQSTNGVQSFYAEINLGANVTFKSLKTSLPEGWQVASNMQDGVLKIAMAGINSLTDGNVAVIELSLKTKESVVTVQGQTTMNDALAASMQTEVREIPNNFSLSQNYPNPFNPTTNINYSIPQDASVRLTVYNSLGQIVKTIVNAQQKAGYYSVRWDGSNDMGSKVSSGMYIYRITAGNFTHAVKMNLIK